MQSTSEDGRRDGIARVPDGSGSGGEKAMDRWRKKHELQGSEEPESEERRDDARRQPHPPRREDEGHQ